MSNKKVLVVDDSMTERHVLTAMLEKNGYEVFTAEGGAEALSKADEVRPDVILMDVVMPGTSGFQATRTISKNEATKHIPIIICSSKGQDTDRIWGLRQGAREYLVKPVSEADLMQKIAALT
ncbi:MAG: response regulator [Burkholderiales bacterium]|jgi:twitching motility two-component system response regulator PilH